MIKKILVSQPKPTSDKSPYFDIEKKEQVEFTFHPFIKVEGLTTREFRQQKVQILDHSAPRVATENAANGQVKAFEWSMLLYGFNGIL